MNVSKYWSPLLLFAHLCALLPLPYLALFVFSCRSRLLFSSPAICIELVLDESLVFALYLAICIYLRNLNNTYCRSLTRIASSFRPRFLFLFCSPLALGTRPSLSKCSYLLYYFAFSFSSCSVRTFAMLPGIYLSD